MGKWWGARFDHSSMPVRGLIERFSGVLKSAIVLFQKIAQKLWYARLVDKNCWSPGLSTQAQLDPSLL